MPKSINEDLARNEFKKAYLIFGQERFLVMYYVNAFSKTGFDIDTFDGVSSTQDIIMAARTLPFLSEKRLVIVKDSGLFATGRKDDSEAMAAFLPEIPDGTIIVFAESDVDRRNRMYKKVVEIGRVVDCETKQPGALTGWVSRVVKEKGKMISPSVASQLLSTVGGNMSVISNELEKLIAYSGNAPEITPSHIQEISTPTLESRIFDMIKAMGNGRISRALSLYRDMLLLKESPIMILTMIIRQFRILLLVKCAAEKNMSRGQIAKELNLRDFIVSEAMEQGRTFTREKLIEALTDCQEVDIKLKTGLVAPEIGVEMLVIKYGNGGC